MWKSEFFLVASICISQMANDVEHLFIDLLDIYITFWKCLIKACALRVKVWFGLHYLFSFLMMSYRCSNRTWQMTRKLTNLPERPSRVGGKGRKPGIVHVWKVVTRYRVFWKELRWKRERWSFSIGLSYNTWLLGISTVCHLTSKTWVLEEAQFPDLQTGDNHALQVC